MKIYKVLMFFTVCTFLTILFFLVRYKEIEYFNNIEEFNMNNSSTDSFLIFEYDYNNKYIEVNELNKNEKFKPKYIIKEDIFPILQFSQVKNTFDKVYINNSGKKNGDITYYDTLNKVFKKDTLQLDGNYTIASNLFYGENVIFIVEDNENKKYLYDYSNNILYDEIPSDYNMSSYNNSIITENSDYIYFIEDLCLYTFNKNTSQYNVYGWVTYDNPDEAISGLFGTFSNFTIPYNDTILVHPINSNYLYELVDGEFIKKFKFKEDDNYSVYDIYFLSDTEILFSLTSLDDNSNNEVYLVDTQNETSKKLDFDYIKDYCNYEFMYEDSKYFYVAGQSLLDENYAKTNFLVFDKITYELLYEFTNENKNLPFFNGYIPFILNN